MDFMKILDGLLIYSTWAEIDQNNLKSNSPPKLNSVAEFYQQVVAELGQAQVWVVKSTQHMIFLFYRFVLLL